jgi:hypothetical protein
VPFPLRLKTRRIVIILAAAYASEVGAVAGWVDFTTGNATVLDGKGRQQSITKGDNLDKGHTVRTGDNGRVQIRFTDGAYVSLQPNTEFSIKDYNFEGKTDGSERGLFALARGAMRTVTGLIGRVNRNRYQVSTPTATIGIRGTGGLIAIQNDGSTVVNGTSGIWTLTNPSGTIDVPAGVSGKAPAAPNQPPQQTRATPSNSPPPPITTQITIAPAEERTADGTSAAVALAKPVLVSGPGYQVSYAYNEPPGSNRNSSGSPADAVFDTTGRLLKFSATNSATFNGTHQEFGTADAVVAWGRWTGPIAAVDTPGPGAIALNPNANNGYHYVVGIPATGMPTTGSASFTMIGATAPTGQNGVLAPGSFSGTFTVTSWSAGTIALGGTIAFPSAGFSYTYNGSGTFSSGGPAFTGTSSSLSVAGQTAATAAGYGCPQGCTVLINGAFFGAGATHAGYGYMVSGASTNSVTGAVVFKQ